MTLQQLRYVTAIAEAGTLSEAARRFYIAQPSLTASLRELEEELGLHMQAEQLHLAGVRRFDWRGSFYGRPFRDRQVSRVYYGVWEGEPQDLHLQESEVSEVVWMDFAACRQAVTANAIPHCIFSEELDLLAQALRIPEESNRDCCKK